MRMNSTEAAQEKLERLSLAQRMLAAKKRRQEQVHQYLIREKWDMGPGGKRSSDTRVSKRVNSSVKVTFDPTSLLFEAVVRNDINEVCQLLKNGICDKDATNSYGFTPLHQSCIDQNLSMIRILVKEFNADVNKCDLEKWTPLHTVALFGFADIAMFLLANGADILALNIDLNMPYDMCDEEETLDAIEAHMASKGITQEKIEIMRRLGERKMMKEMQQHFASGRFSSHKFVGSHGESLLHIASANGYYDVASFLLSKLKHPVSCFDNDLWQPIHAAAYWQQVKVVELLLSNGADIYVRNNEGENALDLCRDKDFAEWLVQTYADKNNNKKNHKSYTNSMKNTMKKSGSSAGHHFNSSVSLNDLNSLTKKRLNTEKKERKQKKDKENEYQLMISSRDEMEYDEPEDDDNNRHHSRHWRIGSFQTPSPALGRTVMMEKARKFSELPEVTDRKGSNEDKGQKKGHRSSTITPLGDKNHLGVNIRKHSTSPDPSEYSVSWDAAAKQMEYMNQGESHRKNSNQSQASVDSKVEAKNKRNKTVKPSALSLEENNVRSSSYEKPDETRSKRSASLVEFKHNSVVQNNARPKSIKKLPRMSISEKDLKKSRPKRCVIS